MKSARVTLTHSDFNVLFDALECLDTEIKDYEGAADPYRVEIQAVVDKLQAARARAS